MQSDGLFFLIGDIFIYQKLSILYHFRNLKFI